MELSETDKGVLLLAAREAIMSAFGNKPEPIVDFNHFPNLKKNFGAFVTLTSNKRLRGCIGYITTPMSLFNTVVDAAKQAAFGDPRFAPLQEGELEKINIEISVLFVPQPINSYEEIIIGKHGLILDEPDNRAVLLPQVAVEHNFSVHQFLNALCEKAWLHPSTWRDRMLNLKVFETNSFSEKGTKEITHGQG